MKTTVEERKEAVALARSYIVVGGQPNEEDAGLIARTLADCAVVFQLHAPVLHAVKRLVTPDGKCAKEWEQPWSDLISAVKAWRAFEAENAEWLKAGT